MKELPSQITGIFIDFFLQYPACCSLVFCTTLYILYPVYYEKTEATKGWRWVASCFVIFVLLLTLSLFLTPVLSFAPDRIIFRPTPSCSTFDNPARYICLTLNEHRQQFYTTTWRKCNNSDPNMKNAGAYYIISSLITCADPHFVTIKSIQFQPESSPDENKQSYILPENYCVRAAGPTGGEKQKVAFYSISGSRLHLLDSGYINSSFLKEFHYGWYLVSNCKSELSRWLFNCTNGYVSSYYVQLPAYTRTLLLDHTHKVPK